jgi:hypothetical protein
MPSRKVKSIVDGNASAEAAALNMTELIARRAYELYESRGSTPGDELTDWLTAEQEVLAGFSSLTSEVKGSTRDRDSVAKAAPRKKASKASTIASGKKATSTATRSTARPKGAHP